MSIKSIANVATSSVARQVLHFKKSSPTVLFVAGVAGVVTAAVLASRATLKLEEVLTKAQADLETARTLEHEDYSDKDRQRDIALVYARTAIKLTKLYGPALAVGTVAVAALTGSHKILTRRNAALAAAYAAIDRGFREYRSRVVSEFGAGKDREFRYGLSDRDVAVDTEEGVVVKTVRDVPASASIYARVFDESNPNWNREHMYNQTFIQCQQNYANDLLNSRGHVMLNDVYDMLGMSRTPAGAIVGWVKGNGDGFIDFGVFEGDRYSGMRFVIGAERSVILDFNVDGVVYELIGSKN